MTSLANIRKQAQRGFTLVELLIVVIILAILAAIVVPQFGSSTDDAKLTALDSNLAGLRSAIAVYKQQHDGHFPGGKASNAAGVTSCTPAGTGDINTTQAFKDQLMLYTNAAGAACGTKTDEFKFGPYMKEIPKDPFKNIDTVTIKTAGALNVSATGTTGGWVFDNVSGRLINNNSSFIPNSTTVKYSDR